MKKKSTLFSLLAVLTLVVANLGAGVNCWLWLYQPKCPKRLMK
ncbi:MAG: cyclic lactone autoinducer peptide [Alkaliphilus sp.]|nr:cyclic lactone autoinducer peptide [bacterium AH-315-G05]PHS36270.1 MAG: cyclic lactone autoinducer peptide [Alkaliphilus sp.]